MTTAAGKTIPLPREMSAMLYTTVEGLLLDIEPEADLGLLRDADELKAYGQGLALCGRLLKISSTGVLPLDEADLDDMLSECIREAKESAEETRKNDPKGHGEDFVMAQARLFQMEGLREIATRCRAEAEGGDA
jgi:hypothetical protein